MNWLFVITVMLGLGYFLVDAVRHQRAAVSAVCAALVSFYLAAVLANAWLASLSKQIQALKQQQRECSGSRNPNDRRLSPGGTSKDVTECNSGCTQFRTSA